MKVIENDCDAMPKSEHAAASFALNCAAIADSTADMTAWDMAGLAILRYRSLHCLFEILLGYLVTGLFSAL